MTPCPHPKRPGSTLCAACKAAERQRIATASLRARRLALAPPLSVGTQAAIDMCRDARERGADPAPYRLALLRGRAGDWGLA